MSFLFSFRQPRRYFCWYQHLRQQPTIPLSLPTSLLSLTVATTTMISKRFFSSSFLFHQKPYNHLHYHRYYHHHLHHHHHHGGYKNDKSGFEKKISGEVKIFESSRPYHNAMLCFQESKVKLQITQQRYYVKKTSFSDPYISSLRKFFLKVHPDFFVSNTKYQETNSKSFQELNSLLTWASQYEDVSFVKKGLVDKPPFMSTVFTFYTKTRPSEKLTPKSVQMIQVAFSIEQYDLSDLNSVPVVVGTIDDAILQLFSKAGIEAPGTFQRQFKGLKVKRGEKTKANTQDFRDEFLKALRGNIYRADMEKLKHGEWAPADLPSVEELKTSKMLHFSKKLTADQIHYASKNISENLVSMSFDVWANIPLNISLTYSVDEVPGFITVPYNFKVNDFNRFILKNLETVKQNRQTLTAAAERIENLVDECTSILKLRSLTIEDGIPTSDIIEFLNELENLATNTPLLTTQYPLHDIRLNLGKQYQISQDGVITFNCKFNLIEVMEFLKFVGVERLENCRKLSNVLAECISKIKTIGSALLEYLNLHDLDIATYNTCNEFEKLEFLNRLNQLKISLGRYDWKNHSILLVDNLPEMPISNQKISVHIDAGNGKISLLKDFSTKELLNEINKLQMKTAENTTSNARNDEGSQKTQEDIKETLRKSSELDEKFKERYAKISKHFEKKEQLLKMFMKDPNSLPEDKISQVFSDFQSVLKHFQPMVERHSRDISEKSGKMEKIFERAVMGADTMMKLLKSEWNDKKD